jgi:hypothetical protein
MMRGEASARILAPACLFLALAACTVSPPQQGAGSGICDPAAAQALVGKPKPTDEQAKRQTGAAIVRQISVGDQVTQDYSDARVTIETDPATGLVAGVSCG